MVCRSRRRRPTWVCVVNLISPDCRYDANFLDNYGQIYVADVLKRINGVSDANVLGRKYAMRIWIDPRPPGEHEDRPDRGDPGNPAGKRAGGRGQDRQPSSPHRADFELPITLKGRLEKASEFEEIIVRRGDDGSIVRIRTSLASSCRRRTTSRPPTSTAKPAGGILIYQYEERQHAHGDHSTPSARR